MWQDFFNGSFELLGSIAIWLHVVQLMKDKEVKGVSWWAFAFFFSWGIWNLYYYPHLNQWASFFGGLFIVAANGTWLWLALKYKDNKGVKGEQL